MLLCAICGVVQCVAVCVAAYTQRETKKAGVCSHPKCVVQRVAAFVAECVAVCCRVVQCVTSYVLQRVAACCSARCRVCCSAL